VHEFGVRAAVKASRYQQESKKQTKQAPRQANCNRAAITTENRLAALIEVSERTGSNAYLDRQ
jgi:hypothetical protein